MHTVFVSHSHQDNALCDAFVEALRARGVDVWYDRSDLQVGHFLSTAIQQELQARTVFILLATPASIASYWVETELAAFRELAAHDRTRVIIPVIMAPVELPLLLRAYKWIDAVGVPLETVVDQLAPTIGFPTRAELAAAERARQAAVDAEQQRRLEEERRAERQRVALELARARAEQRAHLSADLFTVGLLTLALLTAASVLLALGVAVLPRAVGVVAGVLAVLLVLVVGGIPLVRRVVVREWSEARRGLATVVSVLLTLAVVLTALFVTKPTVFNKATPQHLGYDFSYTYHAPTHTGGSMTLGIVQGVETLAPDGLGQGPPVRDILPPTWDGCVVQLPDQTLGFDGWRADQCTEVPTVDNGGESPDGKTTTFRIDPRAVWSDGVPLSAADFLFGERLFADPNIWGLPPYTQMKTLTATDSHTVQIRWAVPTADYLVGVAALTPLPLHVFATGKFAGVYNAVTGAYNTALAQQLNADSSFNTTIPVDNGPFLVKSFVSDQQAVLVKNPRFFSNYFHGPHLDQITLLSMIQDLPSQLRDPQFNPLAALEADAISRFRQGGLDLALSLEPVDLRQLGGIPRRDVITSSLPDFTQLEFNQRTAAPNARTNGGVSIFKNPTVRQAFVEAFDRCAAVRAQLGTVNCGDPNLFTDEALVAAPDATYDPTFHLPAYNPTDAARLMDGAGYPVVDGVRRTKDGRTPLQVELVVTSGARAGAAVIAQRLQHDYAQNLQVDVTVVNPTNFGPYILSGSFDLFLAAEHAPADPVGRLTGEQGPFDLADIISPQNPNGWNPDGIIDPYANQRDQLAAQTLSEVARTEILRNLARYFSQQYYLEEIYIRADITLTKPTLCNFKHWPTFGMDLWNIADWYIAPSCP
jgi:peptide/nickel transport system substrate-binding protein